MNDAATIIEYLDTLKKTSGTNDKINLLKLYLQNEDFKRMAQLALTSTYAFGVSNIPKKNAMPLFEKQTSLQEVFDCLEEMSKKRGVTDEEKEALAYTVCEPSLRRIANLIVKKKLDCGVSAKSINKAMPGTVFIMPYMRCRDIKHIHRITYPATLDIKADGMFLNVLCKYSGPEYKTRPGHVFPLHNPEIDEYLSKLFPYDEVVLTGEARIYNNGYLSRKTGNGILNSILQGTALPDQHKNVVLTIWDVIPISDFYAGKCDTPYKDRIGALIDAGLTEKTFPVNLIHSVMVDTEEHAYETVKHWIEQGQEGGVLKNLNGIWKDTSSGSPDCIKLKSEKECDLRITGWNYAEEGSKYNGMMGSVTCETEDGGLIVDVSGWNDVERTWDWDEHIGKIITVKFNETITRKTDDVYSLFLPRVSKEDRASFVEFRHDKTRANTTEEVLKKR